MQTVNLGKTGMKVSRLCLGCMTYGSPEWSIHPWAMPEQESRPFITRAFDKGINFFDTADYYSVGASETILGNVLNGLAPRSEFVIATKVGLSMEAGPNSTGLSRKHIMEAVDASLKRLQTDYIDLYYIHRLDGVTPFEETCEALNDLVRAGKVLYLGASSSWTWEFVKMREIQKANGWAQFDVMQNFYNLAYREEEREMNPYCKAEGVALVPWSPLARGFLAGNRRADGTATNRASTDKFAQNYFGTEQDYEILQAVETVAKKLEIKPAQLALAWVLAKGVTAPIIGATKDYHLDDAIAALDISLDDETIAKLEAPYQPRQVMGHQ